MSSWYKLVGTTPVKCDIKDLGEENRVVGKDTVKVFEESVSISTVFLSLDHSHGGDRPVLFETMIFGGHYDQEQYRYYTWEDAEIGHKALVEYAQGVIDSDELNTIMNKLMA